MCSQSPKVELLRQAFDVPAKAWLQSVRGKGRLTAAEAGPAARADLCDRQPQIRGAAGAPETQPLEQGEDEDE
jgi:hypothetical protein